MSLSFIYNINFNYFSKFGSFGPDRTEPNYFGSVETKILVPFDSRKNENSIFGLFSDRMDQMLTPIYGPVLQRFLWFVRSWVEITPGKSQVLLLYCRVFSCLVYLNMKLISNSFKIYVPNRKSISFRNVCVVCVSCIFRGIIIKL